MENVSHVVIGGLLDFFNSLFRKRKIVPYGVETPLLVPSFSSRGYPRLARLFEQMAPHNFGSILVSAYDIHHNALPPSAVSSAEVTFVDSGGYETRPDGDLHEPYIDERAALSWSSEAYQNVLSHLPTDCLFVVVTYDLSEPKPLQEQVRDALKYLDAAFASKPVQRPAVDFLYKPETATARFVDIDRLMEGLHLCSDFSILGVTEKELGSSPLERCKAIARLRTEMNSRKLDLPIHIFGSLTPLSIVAYSLCGADVFDGLAWLRFSLDSAPPAHGIEAAIANQKAHLSDAEHYRHQCRANLLFLSRLQRVLRAFQDRPVRQVLEQFPVLAPHLPALLALIEQVDLPHGEKNHG